MEIESSSQDIEINLLDNYCFKLLYPNQKYKKSIDYQNWKKSVSKKGNGIEIFCNKDNIIIYKKNKDLNQLKCPICKEYFYFCPYCKRAEKCRKCCIKSYIKDILNDELLFKFINNKDKKKDFIEMFSYMFIPFLLNIVIYFSIFCILYFGIVKNGVSISEKKSDYFWILYIIYIITFMGFILLMALIYERPLFICYIILIIFSLPFNLYPIKLIFGFLDLVI